MPAIRTLIDGTPIATVSTDGQMLVSVLIQGTVVEESPGIMEILGTSQPEQGEATHLIWVSNQAVQCGQQVTVQFLADAGIGL